MWDIKQIGKEVVTFYFCLRSVHHGIPKGLSLTLTWKSESLALQKN